MSIITFSQSEREYTEAVGSLYQREVLAYLVSLKFKFSFKRSRLIFYKKHNPKFKTVKFHKLFGFFNNFKLKKKYKIIDVKGLNNKYNKNTLYNLPFHISEKIISKLILKQRNILINKFRNDFWNYNKKIKKTNKYTSLVLHIRNKSKGDVIFGDDTLPYQIFSHDYKLPNNNPYFYTNWYVTLVKKILNENKRSKKIKIVICSTGKKKDFKDLYNRLNKICETQLYLNVDEFKTFKKMITADHLVLSQSSFSYLASLVSRGKKYVRNGFRHPLSRDVEVVRDYDLFKTSYTYFLYCKILEKFSFFKLFLRNTNFRQIIKNKFRSYKAIYNYEKLLIKLKGLFPVKFKTFLKKFKKFNGYQGLDKRMLKYINYRNGFYIECGANDGVNQSNTWYFEKKLGWKGLLIEPIESVFNELKKNRNKKNYFFQNALRPINFKKKVIQLNLNENDTLTTKSSTDNIKRKKIKVSTINLNYLLDKINAPKVIDFFSLDVEGDEFLALRGVNFKKYSFKYLLVECDKFFELNKFLVSYNYKFVKKMSVGNDYLFKSFKTK